jgi:hypothetical protein
MFLMKMINIVSAVVICLIIRGVPMYKFDVIFTIFIVVTSLCGGGLECIHRSHACRRRRRKRNLVPGGITGPLSHWGT